MQIFKFNQRQFLITILWWLFWCLAQTLVYHRIGLPWLHALAESAFTTALLALVGFIVLNTFRYYSPVSEHLWLIPGYILIITAITGRIMYWSLKTYNIDNPTYEIEFLKYMPLRGMFYLLMITFLTLYYYFQSKERALNNIKKREREAENLMREAELARLRQQLQPHFLFNSLNSISALAGSKPEQARKMIQQLSDFLRGTVKKDDQQLVVLSEEFKHLELYLEIEKVRFGHRLNTEMTFDKSLESMKLPSLLLQPVVENAVKFGLYDTTDAITIRINAREEKNHLIITIENPFDPETVRPAGTGFGLTSVQRRLYLLYARQDLLETEKKDRIFITRLTIPQTI